MSTLKVTDNMIESVNAEGLTGNMPAIDASALTNITGFPDTKSSNDPATDTNPSAVGHTWVNKTSGEMFVCTDATADANVWTNIGEGSGNVGFAGAPGIPGFPFHGNHWFYGGTHGGVSTNQIIYHSLTSDNHAVVGHNAAVGSTTTPTIGSAVSMSSATHSVVTSGYWGSIPLNITEKFAYASATTAQNGATDICEDFGQLGTPNIFGNGEHACQSETHGFIGGGRSGDYSSFGYADPSRSVRKYQFSNGTVSSQIATMSDVRNGHCSLNGSTAGFWCAGHYGHQNSQNPYSIPSIDKYTFASDSMQHSWGTLSDHRMTSATASSTASHGYMYGGHICCYQPNSGTAITTIEEFSFASSSQKANHGNISTSIGTSGASGAQTSTHGYEVCGAARNTGVPITTIDGFSFASNTTAAQTADIGITISGAANCQPPTFAF